MLIDLSFYQIFFSFNRVQVQKTKARKTDIVLPWENDGQNEISSSVGTKVGGNPKDISGLAFNSVANYYGRLDHNKMDRIGGSPPVIDMKKLRTVQEDSAVSSHFEHLFARGHESVMCLLTFQTVQLLVCLLTFQTVG